MEALRAGLEALCEFNLGVTPAKEHAVANLLYQYQQLGAELRATTGGMPNSFVNCVVAFCDDYHDLLRAWPTICDCMLTAPHYDELVLPLLRRASPEQGAGLSVLVALSRPETLRPAQRQEAVQLACRCASALPAASLERLRCCEMLLLLTNACLNGILRVPQDTGTEARAAAIEAALQHGALVTALECLGSYDPPAVPATQTAIPRLHRLLVVLCIALPTVCATKGQGWRDALNNRISACVAASPKLARRLEAALRSDSQEANLAGISVACQCAMAQSAPALRNLHAAGAGPALRQVAGRAWMQRREYEPLRRSVMRVQQGLRSLDAAASSNLADVPADSLRGHLAPLPMRQLRQMAREMGADCSGCLEKGEVVDRLVAAALATRSPANPAAPPRCEGPQPAGSDAQASGSGSGQGPDRRCARCGATPGGTTKLRPCACRLVRYCGERCQSEDWLGHKAACKEARRRQKRQAA